MGEGKTVRDISHVEQVLYQDDDLKKEDMDLSRVDKEVGITSIMALQLYRIFKLTHDARSKCTPAVAW
jgi:hypothetical protein